MNWPNIESAIRESWEDKARKAAEEGIRTRLEEYEAKRRVQLAQATTPEDIEAINVKWDIRIADMRDRHQKRLADKIVKHNGRR